MTYRVTFKRIWLYISKGYLRTSLFATWLVGRRTQNSVEVGGPKEFPKLLCLSVENSIPLSYSSLSGKTTVWPLHTNWPISIFQNSTSANNSSLLGKSISKEFIKVIPLKMMYYPDFFMSSLPSPTPALSRLQQLGLKRNKLVATPLTVLEK